MCNYEPFITGSSPSWPLMIQQNYFTDAFPAAEDHCTGQQQSPLALPEVAGVPGKVFGVTVSSGIGGLKWNMWTLTWCSCWGLTSKQRGWSWWGWCPGRAAGSGSGCSRSVLSGGRGGPAVWSGGLCAVELLPAPCAALLRQHSTRTFLNFFCCQLKEFCKGFAKQQARGAGGKSRRSASLPLPLPAGLRQG